MWGTTTGKAGTGRLAEVLGPDAVGRDRLARMVRFRGDWNKEWESYSPDGRRIATAFVNGINAYIKSLNGKRPLEFRLAGYDPGLWTVEDVAARIAGLGMTSNLTTEVSRATEIANFGVANVERFQPPDPFVHLTPPPGIDLKAITSAIVKDYQAATGAARFPGEAGAAPAKSGSGHGGGHGGHGSSGAVSGGHSHSSHESGAVRAMGNSGSGATASRGSTSGSGCRRDERGSCGERDMSGAVRAPRSFAAASSGRC